MAKKPKRRKTGYTKRLTPQQFQGKLRKAKTLPEFLALIHDVRRGQGKMHGLVNILLIIIMATMSGYHGQRATGDFVTKHHAEFIKLLKPRSGKLPSYQTIARTMQNLDYEQLTTVFLAWTKTVIRIEDKDWMSLPLT